MIGVPLTVVVVTDTEFWVLMDSFGMLGLDRHCICIEFAPECDSVGRRESVLVAGLFTLTIVPDLLY